MKVIQVIPSLCMGGAEIMCESLTIELAKKGIDIKIVSLYSYETPITERLIKAGVEIIFLDKKPGIDLSILKKLKKLFKEEQPDVVHSHLNAQKYAMIAAKRAGVPTRVHTVHNVAEKELNKIDRFLAKRFYKKHNVIPVALSDAIHSTIIKTYEIPADSVPIILNGIDLSRCLVKNNYDIKDTIKILHIGRFSEQKNHKGLIDAFKIFHALKPNSILKLIGTGDKFDEINEYVAENNLTDSVQFLGIQTNVYPYINEADIFVLPSLYEGIPITLIEAMGTGIPIVATNVGGIPDMLTNGKNAILTPVNTEKIAESFWELAENQEKRKLLGENAKKEAIKLSVEIMAEKYLEIYKKM